MKRFRRILLCLLVLICLSYAAAGHAAFRLPQNLTEIADRAFAGDTSISGPFNMPEGVTSIGEEAFAGCTNMFIYELPESLTYIGPRAFANTGMYGEIVLPRDVVVGEGAFDGCEQLTVLYTSREHPFVYEIVDGKSITIHDTVYSDYMPEANNPEFDSPDKIPHVRIPDTIDGLPVTRIDDYALEGMAFMVCVNGVLAIPDMVKEIGERAFADTSGETNDAIGTLILPKDLESIGAEAFYGCTGLSGDLTIPGGAKEVGDCAFYNCTGFDGTLTLSENLKTIGKSAFYGCASLTGDLLIPDSVTAIEKEAFYGCTGFDGTLTLSANLKTISESAFYGCASLTGNLIIPDSVTAIEKEAFYSCTGFDGTLMLSENLKTIGDSVFSYCASLTGDLILPDSVTSIGVGAFARCSGFDGEIRLSSALTKISRAAFNGCTSLTGRLVIPETDYAWKIEEYAFADCKGLRGVPYLPEHIDIASNAFDGCTGFDGALILSYASRLSAAEAKVCFADSPSLEIYDGCPRNQDFLYEIEDGGVAITGFTAKIPKDMEQFMIPWMIDGLPVTKIAQDAFYERSGLRMTYMTGINLPDTLTEIGANAFAECWNMRGSLVIPESVVSIGDYAFYNCGLDGTLTLSKNLEAINEGAFGECEELQGQLIIPEGVKRIGDYAFDLCSGLSGKLVLPDGLESIGSYAFGSCGKLTGDLIIPDSVTSIGSGAFYDCCSFDGVLKISENLSYIEGETFKYCEKLTGDLVIPACVTDIDAEAFYYCSGLDGTLTLPESLEYIGWNVFLGCSGLTGNLVIPAGVYTIDDGAFKYCSGFDGTLTLPEGLGYIGWEAFYDCNQLTGDLILPEGIDTVYPETFFQCYSMKGDLCLPSGLLEIGYSAFEGAGFAGVLSLPEGLTAIGENAFARSGFTGSLVLPQSLEYLGEGAFNACRGLTGDLTIPGGVTEIYPYVFENCTGLDGTLTLPGAVERIGEYAFSGCSFSGWLTLPASLAEIGDYAFYDCRDLMELEPLEGLVFIGDSAFMNCIGLSGLLTIPSTVEVIGPSAFRNCLSLDGVYVKTDSLRSIGDYAFRGCTLVHSTVVVPDDVQLGEGTFDESEKLHILRQSLYEAAKQTARESLVASMKNVIEPDELFSAMKDENVTWYQFLANIAQDIIHGEYDDIVLGSTMKKEAYLFNQVILANQGSSVGLINPYGNYSEELTEILEGINTGAEATMHTYFDAAILMSGTILTDNVLDAAFNAFDKYCSGKISWRSLKAVFERYGIKGNELTAVAEAVWAFEKIHKIADAAKVLHVGCNVIDIYNQYMLMESIDKEELRKIALHYQRSNDIVIHHLGLNLYEYCEKPETERIKAIVSGTLIPEVINDLVSKVIDQKVDISSGTMLTVKLSSFVIDSLTGVDEISRLRDEIGYSVDLARSNYSLFELDYFAYTLSPASDTLLVNAVTSYMHYCTSAAQSLEAYYALYEHVNNHAAGALIGDEAREVFELGKYQGELLAGMAERPKDMRDFLQDDDYDAFINGQVQ